MDKLFILKGGVELLTSIGVGSIVGNAIKMTTDPNAGRLKKIAIGFGGFVLSSMTSELATTYTNQKIDVAAERIKEIFNARATITVDKDGVDLDIENILIPDEVYERELDDPSLRIIKKDKDSE